MNDERDDRAHGGTEELEALLRAVSELPREIRPARDLWPGVEARVRAESAPDATERGSDGTRSSGRFGSTSTGWLAAAAVVLAALTAATTLWLAGGPGPDAGGRIAGAPEAAAATDSLLGRPSVAGSAAVAAGLQQLEEGYRPAVERLTRLLEARDERLSPETREVLDRNLRIIDAAIAESERALLEHPGSDAQMRALDRRYRQKVEMLERSVRLTAQL